MYEDDTSEAQIVWFSEGIHYVPIALGSVSVIVLRDAPLPWESILDLFAEAHQILSYSVPRTIAFIIPDREWADVDFLLIATAMGRVGGASYIFPLNRMLVEVYATTRIFERNRLYMIWVIGDATALDTDYVHLMPSLDSPTDDLIIAQPSNLVI